MCLRLLFRSQSSVSLLRSRIVRSASRPFSLPRENFARGAASPQNQGRTLRPFLCVSHFGRVRCSTLPRPRTEKNANRIPSLRLEHLRLSSKPYPTIAAARQISQHPALSVQGVCINACVCSSARKVPFRSSARGVCVPPCVRSRSLARTLLAGRLRRKIPAEIPTSFLT